MTAAIVIAACCMIPVDGVVVDHVDEIEINHLYNAEGERTLDQVIFWNWPKHHERPQVVAWRLWDAKKPMPTRNKVTCRTELTWIDGEQPRRVVAKVWRETWTQYDPEVEDRRFLSQNERLELSSLPYAAKQVETPSDSDLDLPPQP